MSDPRKVHNDPVASLDMQIVELISSIKSKADKTGSTGGGGNILLSSTYNPSGTSGILLCSQYNPAAT
jgi:hypothetical protein